MLDGAFFTKLLAVAAVLRPLHSGASAGIQLVLCGDFFQLCPVARPLKYLFKQLAWGRLELETIHLTQVRLAVPWPCLNSPARRVSSASSERALPR